MIHTIIRERCAHCGNVWAPQAFLNDVAVCHTDWRENEPPDAQDDCYRLVTVYGEVLGSRLPKDSSDVIRAFVNGEEGSREALLEFLGMTEEELADLEYETPEEDGEGVEEAVERLTCTYDKAGNPISFEEHMRLSREPAYKHVANTRLDSRLVGAGVRISTVWTGSNTNSYGQPDIFETMIFSDLGEVDPNDRWQLRYSTEEQAREGHEAVVARLQQLMAGRASRTDPGPPEPAEEPEEDEA